MSGQEKIKVVAIDDEPDLCVLLKAILEETGEFEVVTTFKPLEAEQVVRQAKPQVILLDIVMPGRKGTEIIESLKKDPELRNIPIIVVSGKGEMVFDKGRKEFKWMPNNPVAVKERGKLPQARGAEALAQAYGVADYVSKPFNSELLVQIIKDVLSRQSRTQPNQDEEPGALE